MRISVLVLACFSQALLLASIFIVSLGITVPLVGELPLTHIFCLTICGTVLTALVVKLGVTTPTYHGSSYRELCEATMDDVEVRMCILTSQEC